MSAAEDPSRLSGESSPSSPASSGSSSPSSGAFDAAAAVADLALTASTSAAGNDADAHVPTSPYVGMYFETEDDAYEFYKAYAARLGFVVRKSNKSKNSRHTVTRRLFVCSKQGFRQEPKKPQDEGAVAASSSSPAPRCPDSRTGCLASLTIKLVPSANAFRVTEFIAGHNHQLASAAAAVSLALLPPSSSHHSIAAAASLPDPRDGPHVDMHFETEEDAYVFYNRYAEHVGFSVRRSYKKRKRGMIVSRIFVCSREGVSDRAKQESGAIVTANGVAGSAGTPRPGPPPTRTGCQARMVVKMTPCQTYRVAKFFPEHNHPLANPESVHKLRESEWLSRLFMEKEKWALPYQRSIFFADILNTLQKDNMITEVKRELSDQEDILQFFKRYEAILEEHRSKKLHADVDGSQVTLPIPSLRMLKQSSNAYTPEAFKMFQASEARFNNVCRLASLIASRAAKSEEAMSYIESQSSVLLKHLDDILQTGYPDMGNHAVPSSSQAISFVSSQHPDHTTQAGVVAQTTNGTIDNVLTFPTYHHSVLFLMNGIMWVMAGLMEL
ncbi:hypothetical protein BAE44_0004305 [Dichanthelium oligosanthes]|uniref:Protein FAR1-RELATED SEQUENCE n=1 Tax=Dichanthelium oligosanthes TaxID=888268 RepID=A0A1E5WBG3_9POAL|nr:hypothetical protein BAE44_0004305 [Dichanthelium oligosanthes]